MATTETLDSLTRAVLANSVACARCHDHKFDPIPTRDYYSLYGVFASSVEPGDLPIIGQARDPVAFAGFQRLQAPDRPHKLQHRATGFELAVRRQL